MKTIIEKQVEQKAFFENLYKNIDSGFIELRTFYKSKPNKPMFLESTNAIDKLQGELNRLRPETDIFFGVSIRKTNSNGKKENCHYLPALYIDIDTGQTGHNKQSYFNTKEDALFHLSKLNLKPSAVVDSGHGVHVYWLLDKPLLLDKDSISKAETLMKHLEMLCGGDTVKDVSRILRVPYTTNWKTNEGVMSKIIHSNYDARISLDEMSDLLDKKGLFPVIAALERSNELKNLVFGIDKDGNEDRSAVDQKIISRLVHFGLEDHQIIGVFNLFPTTGKYLERKVKDEKGAESYLLLSINNARNYISPDITTFSKSKRSSLTNPKYKIIEEGEECGYYLRNGLDDSEWKMLTNFVIKLNDQIKATYNGKSETYCGGKVIVGGNLEFPFERLSASLFASQQKFDEFLHQLCGVKIQLNGSFKHVIDVIKEHNRAIDIITAVEFGYNDELTEYRTSDCIIRSEEVEQKKTPIMYSNEWRKNKVGFISDSKVELTEVKKIIIEHLLRWDEYKISLLCFSFVMLALLYPFLKNTVEGKPYLLITGDSGSGKTTVSRFYQSFFGQFQSLFPATSTATSINIAGHAMKDVLFCIDDLKISALSSDAKRNAFMSTIQNYSDGNSRNRANVNLEILDEKEIRGLLMINGEDIVMTEASTVARGIILYLNKKEAKNEEVRYLAESSKYFSSFTLNFIQHLLNIKDKIDYNSLVMENINYIQKVGDAEKLNGENLPRIINNLALVKTAWDISKVFLFEGMEYKAEDYDNYFNLGIREVLVNNFNRAHNFKADEKFEEILWTLISNKSLLIQSSEDLSDYIQSNRLGYYQQKKDGCVMLGINLRVAYKAVDDFLRNQGGLGIQYESLKNRLLENKKIEIPKAGMLTIGNKQMRGAYWIGEIPKDALGIYQGTEDNELPSTPVVQIEDEIFSEDLIIS
jgi:hypothetical protein